MKIRGQNEADPLLQIATLQMRVEQVVKRSKARATSLRQLNKHVTCLQQKIEEAKRSAQFLADQLLNERERQKRTDYRSVCQCVSCRFREWYRFRNGETHPGRVGRRFLSFLPRWR